MALPTSGLTGHWDASTNADIFDTFSGGVLSGNPTNGSNWLYWKNRQDNTGGAAQGVFGLEGTSPDATWHTTGPMRLPSIRINNGKLRTENLSNIALGFTNFMTVSGAMMLLAFNIDSASIIPNSIPGGGGQYYFNATLIGGERNTYWSVYVRLDGSQANLIAYNWDGDDDTIEIPITLDETHVLCMRHDGGNLFLSVDCGAEQSTPSGNTDNSTPIFIGDQGINSGTTAEIRGSFGEVAFYNHGQSSVAVEAAAYLCDKWLSPEIVDDSDPTLPDRSCTVSAGGGQGAGGCVVAFPTIGTQACVGGGLVPTAPDLSPSEVWWGSA